MMKTILFITYSFGKDTPVGVGSERVVKALANRGCRIIVITSSKVVVSIPNIQFIVKKNSPRLPSNFSAKLSNIVGRELFYFAWEIKAYIAAKKQLHKNKYVDVIYTRSNPISVCPIGIRLKKKFHIPLLMHFTDPIPAPKEWCPDPKSRKRMIKQMQFLLPHADLISFGNPHMLRYEKNVMSISLPNAFISPDPVSRGFVYLPKKTEHKETFNLLFLGNIYGNRNPSCLFEAIEQLSNYPIKLFLYGTNNGNFPDFVTVKDRTDDIDSVMQNMDVLVDIDGDDETPVFVSSKLKDYLSVNRPIFAISPNNSPSREILFGLHTVNISINETQHIRNILLSLMNTKYQDSDYEDRKKVLELFSADQIALEILNQINSLTK